MDEKQNLEVTLNLAKQLLGILEQQAAGYTSLTIPAPLKLQLEDKRREVTDLESRLAQLSGQTAKAVPDNLPRQSIFIGRKAEIEQCLAALTPEDRSWGVVIDGIGGMGKTALALEVAQRARSTASFAAYLFVSAKTNRMTIDGVREETLAATSLDAFVREFARLLGEQEIVRVTDATERRQALLDTLRGRRVLLIWDNLETLTAEERKQIGDFLLKLPAPNKAIVTSRYRAGESGFPIRLDRLAETDALELMETFGKRHRRVAGELRYAGEEAQRTLYEAAGGCPLVLNLALGFIAQKGWSFQQVLGYVRDPERSKDLYTFLFTDALQTISENDGAVLSALSAMQTPAEPSLLVEVTKRTDREIEMALEQLVMLSLVNDLEGGRYILHPLTRAYLQKALTMNNGAGQPPNTTKLDTAIRRNVLQHWVDYAEQHSGEGNPENYQRLEAAWPNLEAIASTLYELADIPTLLNGRMSQASEEAARMLVDLARALDNFWNWGYWDEYIRLNEWAYEAAQALGDWRSAGWRAKGMAWIYSLKRDAASISKWAYVMETAVVRVGDREGQAGVIRLRGLAAEVGGNSKRAEAFYLEALAIYKTLNQKEGEASVLNDLGGIARQNEDYASAEAYYKQALAIHKSFAYNGQPTIMVCLGNVALDRNQSAIACSWYGQALVLARELGQQDIIAYAQHSLAQVLETEGRFLEALERAEEALSIRERLRDSRLELTRQLVARLRQKVQEQKE